MGRKVKAALGGGGSRQTEPEAFEEGQEDNAARESRFSHLCDCHECSTDEIITDPDHDDERCAQAMQELYGSASTPGERVSIALKTFIGMIEDGVTRDASTVYDYMHNMVVNIDSAPTQALHSILRSYNRLVALEPHSDNELELKRARLISTWRELMTSDLCLKALVAADVASTEVSKDDHQWPLRPVVDKQNVRDQILRAFHTGAPGHAHDRNPEWNRLTSVINSAAPEAVMFTALSVTAEDLREGKDIVPNSPAGTLALLNVFGEFPMTKRIIEETGILSAMELVRDHRDSAIQAKVDDLVAEWRLLVKTPAVHPRMTNSRGTEHSPRSSIHTHDNTFTHENNDTPSIETKTMKEKAAVTPPNHATPCGTFDGLYQEHPQYEQFLSSSGGFVSWAQKFLSIGQCTRNVLEEDLRKLYAALPCLIDELTKAEHEGFSESIAQEDQKATIDALEADIAHLELDTKRTTSSELKQKELAEVRRQFRATTAALRTAQASSNQVRGEMMTLILRPTKTIILDMKHHQIRFRQEYMEMRGHNDSLRSEMDGLKRQLASSADAVKAVKAQQKNLYDKQLSKYYQDVEKGVRDATSHVQSQLSSAKAEAALYKKTLAEKEELQKKILKLEEERSQLIAAKSQRESDCKAAEEATRVMTEGYEQLKKGNEQLEAKGYELQAELDAMSQNQKELLEKQELAKDTDIAPKTSTSTKPAIIQPEPQAVASTATLDKYTREVQHLNGTITVWESMLNAAAAAKSDTQAKKEQADVQIRDIECQLVAVKRTKEDTAPGPSVSKLNINAKVSAGPLGLKVSGAEAGGNDQPLQPPSERRMLPAQAGPKPVEAFPPLAASVPKLSFPAAAAPPTMRIVAPAMGKNVGSTEAQSKT